MFQYIPRHSVRLWLCWAVALIVSSESALARLHNGERSDVPQVVDIAVNGHGCSSTLVSSRVLVTAAHCLDSGKVSGRRFDGVGTFGANGRKVKIRCEGVDATDTPTDVAACAVLEEPIPVEEIEPACVGNNPLKPGEKVTYIGFGTHNTGNGAAPVQDGLQRRGEQAISAVSAGEIVSYSQNVYGTDGTKPKDVAFGSGDSGGFTGLDTDRGLVILGVNSRVSARSPKEGGHLAFNSRGNHSTDLNSAESQAFLKGFAERYHAEICGVTYADPRNGHAPSPASPERKKKEEDKTKEPNHTQGKKGAAPSRPTDPSGGLSEAALKERLAFSLGLKIRDGEPLQEDSQRAAQVERVEPGSIAATKLGLHAGDLVTSINGEKVNGPDHLRFLMRKLLADSSRTSAEIEIVRGGAATREKITVPLPEEQRDQFRLGFVPTAVTGKTVLVGEVVAGLPGAQKGLAPGDTIVAINAAPVQSSDHFVAALNAAKRSPDVTELVLTVQDRQGSRREIAFPLPATGGAEAKPHGQEPSPPPKERPEAKQGFDFECVAVEGGFKPQDREVRRPLGGQPIPDRRDCEAAVENSANRLVCSYTGIGWKVTHHRGTIPARPDYGYWGSSTSLRECLHASRHSRPDRVCAWGGSFWWIATTDGRKNGSFPGQFPTVEACVASFPAAHAEKESSPAPPSGTGPPHSDSPTVLGKHCVECHSTGSSGSSYRFPAWALEADSLPETLRARLASAQPDERTEAEALVKKLYSTLLLEHSMPPGAERQGTFGSDPRAKELFEAVQEAHTQISSHATNPGTDRAPNAIQILEPSRLAQYRAILKGVQVLDPELASVLNDPNTLLFDKDSLPPAYQDADGPIAWGVRSTQPGFRGAGFAKDTPFLDPKTGDLKLFGHPVGLSADGSSQVFNLLALPRDEKGNLKKIRVSKRVIPPENEPTWDWKFPEGTVSMEVIYAKDAAGHGHVQDIRVRKKGKDSEPWTSDMLRPFPTKTSLETKLKELASDSTGDRTSTAKEAGEVLSRLQEGGHLQELKLGNSGYDRGSFELNGATEVLPPMSENLVRKLLEGTPFRSSKGQHWAKEGEMEAFAPTSRQSFGIVPQHSSEGAVAVTQTNCNKCHETSNRPFREFFDRSHPLYFSSIYSYGNVPGSDRNLRWHPWDPSRLSSFGAQATGDNRTFRKEFLPILDVGSR